MEIRQGLRCVDILLFYFVIDFFFFFDDGSPREAHSRDDRVPVLSCRQVLPFATPTRSRSSVGGEALLWQPSQTLIGSISGSVGVQSVPHLSTSHRLEEGNERKTTLVCPSLSLSFCVSLLSDKDWPVHLVCPGVT